MNSFLQVCEDTTNKLGRALQDDEIKFLQWMYERYKEEQLGSELEYTEI